MRFLIPLFAFGVTAHHMMTTIHINGVSQGDGTCVRVPPNTNPFIGVGDANIACNTGGSVGVKRVCGIDAGQKITFEWRTWPDGSQNAPIDPSHQGPCAVYMKRVDDFMTTPAAGGGWFKIWHDGYRDGEFCVERLRRNGGMMEAAIPQDLAGGDYLIRAETIALHQAQNRDGAQWYISCAQLHVYSTGGNANPPTVSIPGFTDAEHRGVLYNLYKTPLNLPYDIPGPRSYVPTSAGGREPEKRREEKPCLVSNANWCAVPVPPFRDEAECYVSSGNCWSQLNACYEEAPVTGHKGCTLWEGICESYLAHCQKCGAERNCRGTFNPKGGVSKRGLKKRELLAGHCDTMMELCETVKPQEVCQELRDNCRKAEDRRKGQQQIASGLQAEGCGLKAEDCKKSPKKP